MVQSRVKAEGPVLARGIPDGPDDDFETPRLTLLGVIACARSSILVVTSFVLPDASLIAALNVATLRGGQVDLVLPAKNELKLMQWASTALLWQVLQRGCRVRLSPPPFDHTKLILVDELWTLLGSAAYVVCYYVRLMHAQHTYEVTDDAALYVNRNVRLSVCTRVPWGRWKR